MDILSNCLLSAQFQYVLNSRSISTQVAYVMREGDSLASLATVTVS